MVYRIAAVLGGIIALVWTVVFFLEAMHWLGPFAAAVASGSFAYIMWPRDEPE